MGFLIFSLNGEKGQHTNKRLKPIIKAKVDKNVSREYILCKSLEPAPHFFIFSF